MTTYNLKLRITGESYELKGYETLNEIMRKSKIEYTLEDFYKKNIYLGGYTL